MHKPETESLLALDVIAGRFARAVRAGLASARPIACPAVKVAKRHVDFSRRPIDLAMAEEEIAKEEANVHEPGTDATYTRVRKAMVRLSTWRTFRDKLKEGRPLARAVEVMGVRLGPVALLAAPFEIMQAIKNDVVLAARAPVPLVMGLANGCLGYAPDRLCAARGGYAADAVPLMVGTPPFAAIHDELAAALLPLDAALDTDYYPRRRPQQGRKGYA